MQKFVNNYETTLTLGIDNSVTSIHVDPSTKFDDLSALTGGDYYLLTISDSTNIEIVKVTAVSVGPTMILTVERDASGSGHGSFSFSAGASVKMNVTAEGLNNLAQIVSNENYPPNYTTNVQTKSASGTVSVPFTPLVIQQVNIDTASGVTLNVTPGATWGECVIVLYRTNLSHAWPALTYNSDIVPVAGDPPGSGNYNAKLLCRSEPGTGYLPNPFVTFEWITRSVIADYPPNYSVTQRTRSTAGTVSIPFTPLVIQQLNLDVSGGVFLNIEAASSFGIATIIIYRTADNHTWPTIYYNGSTAPISGQPPESGVRTAKLLCRVEPTLGGSAPNPFVTFEWATTNSSAAVPSADGVVTQLGVLGSTTANIVLLTATAAYRATINAGVTINFDSTGFTTAMTKTIRLAFMLGASVGAPTITYNNFPVTISGTAPAVGSICILEGVFIEGDGNFQSLQWMPYSSVD